ncbi:MAG: VWA domain-containing protein [Candidatus Aminicenantes bacterium]|nr:VWA domain-containing protein [Candidatus Aminicenantes bacterium]
MVQTLIKPKKVKQLARTDIVFCIDISDSMRPCLEGVRQNIENFVDLVGSDPETAIDWRLGLLWHQVDVRNNCLSIDKLPGEFTTDINAFKQCLSYISGKVGGGEANLLALDWCLDFGWRSDAHKFIVLFTDEGVGSGFDPLLSLSKVDQLIKKIAAVGASVHFITYDGPEFDDYRKIALTNKCHHIEVPAGSGFAELNFAEIMSKLGKSVSSGSRGAVQGQQVVERDIYGILKWPTNAFDIAKSGEN